MGNKILVIIIDNITIEYFDNYFHQMFLLVSSKASLIHEWIYNIALGAFWLKETPQFFFVVIGNAPAMEGFFRSEIGNINLMNGILFLTVLRLKHLIKIIWNEF